MAKKVKEIKKREVSEVKKVLLKEIISKLDKNKTVMVTSALSIPSALFQQIRKDLRGKAELKLVKKSLGIKAVENSKKEGIKDMVKYLDASSAFIFSDVDPYELASIFLESKQPAFAKAGQIAPEDLVIEKGPTDLLPGPAISELGAVGLKVGVEGGKIAVKETKAIVKKGEVISKNAADVLQKLGLKPFNIGLLPIAVYDSNDKKIYTNIVIDKEGSLNELKSAFLSAYNFAANMQYACKETINKIVEMAEREALALNSLISQASSQ